MSDPLALRTRRQFLRDTVLGGALGWTAPSFLAGTFAALHASAAGSATQTATGKDAPILVVVQLAGGNDGLNTVIPIGNDDYYRARPKLGIRASKTLKLTDETGLHPSLAGFKALADAGHLTVIQGAGYPNPNRSHFRSTEIWQTASDADRIEKHGWLGRYFDSACRGADPTVGVSVGNQAPQAFASERPTGVCLQQPENYRFMGGKGKAGEIVAEEQSYRDLNQLDAPEMQPAGHADSGATIDSVGGAAAAHPSPLDFLERTALDAQVSSDRILEVTQRVATRGDYPSSPLGNAMRLVARLVGGAMPTRVYYVSQGGYDTHTNQAGAHQRLLADLGDSIKAFVTDMKAQGNFSRVLVMTFSEFGRRVAENASGGTDHGAAAPLFIVREQAQHPFVGRHANLAPEALFNGDIVHQIDFRSIYASILDQWLKTDSAAVLGRRFAPPPGLFG